MITLILSNGEVFISGLLEGKGRYTVMVPNVGRME